MFKCVYVPNIVSLGIPACFKKLHIKVGAFALIQRQNSCYFRCLVWKTKCW